MENQTHGQHQAIGNSDGEARFSEFVQPTPEQRTRFLLRLFALNADAVSDCELLELILAAAAPQSDKHALAIRLLERFGDVNSIMYADVHLLKTIEGVDDAMLQAFAIMRLMVQRMVKTNIIDQPVIQEWSSLMDYCKLKIGHNHVEEFHILFLNQRHALIADERMQRGTVNHTPVYAREIVKRALELSASALIMLHNHPSGDPTPSKSDVENTKKIIEAAAMVNITVHDHVIVTDSGYYSFKSFGLI